MVALLLDSTVFPLKHSENPSPQAVLLPLTTFSAQIIYQSAFLVYLHGPLVPYAQLSHANRVVVGVLSIVLVTVDVIVVVAVVVLLVVAVVVTDVEGSVHLSKAVGQPDVPNATQIPVLLLIQGPTLESWHPGHEYGMTVATVDTTVVDVVDSVWPPTQGSNPAAHVPFASNSYAAQAFNSG